MKPTHLLLTILLTASALAQRDRARDPRHSTMLRRNNKQGSNKNNNKREAQHTKMIELMNSIRKMSKKYQNMKKRETFLRKNVKSGVVQKKQIQRREKYVNRFRNRVQNQKKEISSIFKSYTNIVKSIGQSLAKESTKLNKKEKNIQSRIERMRIKAKKNKINFNNLSDALQKERQDLNKRAQNQRKTVKERYEAIRNNPEVIKKIEKALSSHELLNNKQKKMTALSQLRKDKAFAMAKIGKEISNMMNHHPKSTSGTSASNLHGSKKEKYQTLMKCVHSFKEQIKLLRKEVEQDATLTEEFTPDENCKKLNPDIGLGANGCFRTALQNFEDLTKSAKTLLSSEALTRFNQISQKIKASAQIMRGNILKKCVNNEGLKRRNKKCADTIRDMFIEFNTDPNTDPNGYMNYLEMNEKIETMMEHDFWTKVNENCNQ